VEELGHFDYLKHSSEHLTLMAAILAEKDMGRQSELHSFKTKIGEILLPAYAAW
jgi:hypothetical protein